MKFRSFTFDQSNLQWGQCRVLITILRKVREALEIEISDSCHLEPFVWHFHCFRCQRTWFILPISWGMLWVLELSAQVVPALQVWSLQTKVWATIFQRVSEPPFDKTLIVSRSLLLKVHQDCWRLFPPISQACTTNSKMCIATHNFPYHLPETLIEEAEPLKYWLEELQYSGQIERVAKTDVWADLPYQYSGLGGLFGLQAALSACFWMDLLHSERLNTIAWSQHQKLWLGLLRGRLNQSQRTNRWAENLLWGLQAEAPHTCVPIKSSFPLKWGLTVFDSRQRNRAEGQQETSSLRLSFMLNILLPCKRL